MKRYLSGLITGALVSILVIIGSVSTLAISSRMTIEVDPINRTTNVR